MKIRDNGFTIIESIVTVAIIALIATISLANYGRLRTQLSLNRAVQETSLEIRRAQNLAVATVKQNGTIPCGYGIHYVNEKEYILFADKDSADEALCGNANRIFDAGEEVQLLTINQDNVKFSTSFTDVLFFPPNPLVFINGSFNPSNQVTVSLCVADDCSSVFKAVKIWGTGLVDIE